VTATAPGVCGLRMRGGRLPVPPSRNGGPRWQRVVVQVRRPRPRRRSERAARFAGRTRGTPRSSATPSAIRKPSRRMAGGSIPRWICQRSSHPRTCWMQPCSDACLGGSCKWRFSDRRQGRSAGRHGPSVGPSAQRAHTRLPSPVVCVEVDDRCFGPEKPCGVSLLDAVFLADVSE
jgi:hypothetical protein